MLKPNSASPFSLRTVLSPDERNPNPSLVASQHRNPAAGSINLQLLRHHHHRPSKPLHALPLGLAGMQMQPRNPIGHGSITRHTTRRSRTTCVQPAAHRQYGEMQLARPRSVLHLHDALFLVPLAASGSFTWPFDGSKHVSSRSVIRHTWFKIRTVSA